MIIYPASELPLPQADYSSKIATNTVTTQFTSGRVRRRRMGHGKYRTAKLAWLLSPEEYDFFVGWWEHVLKLGTRQFTVDMATGAIMGPHVVLLYSDPEESLQDYFWRVSCDAVIYSKPELSETDVVLRSEGLSEAELVQLEDILNTIVNTDLPTTLEH